MNLIVEERTIPSGAESIWELIAAVENLPQWMPGVQTAKLLGIQRTGIGRRQQVTQDWREWVQEQVLIAWEPGRRIGWRTLTNQIRGKKLEQIEDLQTIITLTEQGEQTRVRIETSWSPVGLKGKLFSLLSLKPVLRRQLRGALQELETSAGREEES